MFYKPQETSFKVDLKLNMKGSEALFNNQFLQQQLITEKITCE